MNAGGRVEWQQRRAEKGWRAASHWTIYIFVCICICICISDQWNYLQGGRLMNAGGRVDWQQRRAE